MLSNLGGLPALLLSGAMAVALVKVARNPARYDVRQDDYDANGRPIRSRKLRPSMSEELLAGTEAPEAGTEPLPVAE
jgi:hypothetical protein